MNTHPAKRSFLGNGITFPLRRVGGDFENTSGEDLALSCIPFLVMTVCDSPRGGGEQPWDTEFGTNIRSIRFSRYSEDVLRGLVQEFLIDKLARYCPRIVVLGVEVSKFKTNEGTFAEISVYVDVVSEGSDVRLVLNETNLVSMTIQI